LDIGQTYEISCKVYPSNATYTLEWVSYKKDIVTVNEKGLVTAVGPGNAYVYLWVFRNDGGCDIVETCEVTVNEKKVTSIQLADESVTMERGTTKELQYTLLPADATNNTLVFKSSNESIASVDEDGVISAISEGICTITVETTDDSNLSASCAIYVVEPYVLGDINEDGTVSVADVTALVNIILGKQEERITYEGKRLADVNDDGIVSIADVTTLVNIILRKWD